MVITCETYVNRFQIYGIKTIFKFNTLPAGTNEFDCLCPGFANLVEK